MSTQAYYKDRLGFDPRETAYDGPPEKYRKTANKPHGYEENLTKFKDERDAVQKKTFTKWVNKHLKKASRQIRDLFEDLRDGHNLISLLEVLTGEQLPRERGQMRFHMLHNIDTALHFLHCKKIKLVNIRSEDIVDGNPKLTLGLIWTIILHFQISDIVVGQEPNVSAKDYLLRWAKRTTHKYPGVHIQDFTKSWRDGLAFSAIIHRNRPDLLDWKTARSQRVRERIETAFYIAEKEYGVTRLLDPEDVDTHELDEKSLITYISSLHEVFPEPPPIHPLFDSNAQQRVQEYRELASSLHMWMREKYSLMQDRSFPSTLIEMKKLASESARFRSDEIPPRERDKTDLNQMYRELEKYFKSIGEIDVEPELRMDNIERSWKKLTVAYQERDRHIIEEIKRLEKLQRLAEKVHREIKQTDANLDSIEHAIETESRKIERLHPLEAKKIADQFDQDLALVEQTIQSLETDVNTLRNGRYSQASDLDKRVIKLHERWVNCRRLLHNKIVQPLANLSFPVEERTVTKHIRTVQETRNVDTNPHFVTLQEHIEWCKKKLKQLKKADYGTDLSSVQTERDIHQKEQRQINQFHSKIDSCVKARQFFSGEELTLYNQHLGQLQKIYTELVSFSTNRMNDLETLLDFVQSASKELQWLNEKEDEEITRDWSDIKLNVNAVENHYERLMSEFEKREIQLSAVQERGECLVLQNHPASKAIEAYMASMQAQWAWLLQLTHCLETHLQNTREYQKFFKDIAVAEEWLKQKDETMNSEFSQGEFSLDVGERLLQGMQALRDELNVFGNQVQTLTARAQDIVPLKQRKQPVTRSYTVKAICNYKQNNFAIEKNKDCTLTDNSGRIKWKVENDKGIECQVPGVCFVITPPDKESLDAADRLRRQYDRSITLWQKKQLRMRQNMIFATIKVVKSWDLPQFIAIGAEQRNAIRKALNDDADKLMTEGDPSDPQLRRLRREMDEVNRLFEEFEKRARAEEESKNQARIFNDQISTLYLSLDEFENTINKRVLAPLPRDIDTLQHLVLEHKEFESRLQAMTPEIEQCKDTFRSIILKTPQHKKDLEKVLNKWKNIWNTSNVYVERLKCIEIVLGGMDDASQIISDFENKLLLFQELPNSPKELEAVHEDLLKLQSAVRPQQVALDQLNDDFDNTRRLTENSRPNHRGPHSDVERLDKEIQKINARWSNVCSQLADRMRNWKQAYNLLKNYKVAKEDEDSWLDEQYGKLENIQPFKDRAKDQLDATRNLLSSVVERAPIIEEVNVNGGRYIREGKQAVEEKYKLCDETLSKLLHWIGEVEDKIASQDVINETEEELRNQINIIKQIKDDLEQHNGHITHIGDQVRQLVLTAGEFLSKSETSTLERNGRNLKIRYDKAVDRSDVLLKRMLSAKDELAKLKSELHVFSTWLGKARRILEDKEKALSDLEHLDFSTDSTKEFVSDVIAHQADLRFITMSAQKFVDEGKEYLKVLNDFRTSLPSRLSHIEPLSSQESSIRREVSLVTQQYRDLLHRTNSLSDRLSGVGGRQREYNDALDKAKEWLRDAEPRAIKLLNEPIAGEPRSVEEQLHKAKTLNNEFVANGRLIDNAKQATLNLIRSLESQLSPSEITRLEQPVIGLEQKYQQLSTALADRCQELDTALIQSQGVQDALDGIIAWLNLAENQFKNIQKPVSLIKERLEEQLREHRVFQSDIDTHISSIDSVYLSAGELITSTSNARIAKKIETKLNDVKARFEKLYDRVQTRGQFLAEVNKNLTLFTNQSSKFEQWYKEVADVIRSFEFSKLSVEEYNYRMREVATNVESQRQLFEETIKCGKDLVNQRDVTDTANVRDKVKSMEHHWRELNNLLEEKLKLSKKLSEQLTSYDSLRQQVSEWLSRMESRLSKLDIVAVELATLKRQSEELKPISKEFKEYVTTIDKINDIGNIYDSLCHGDKPESPTKRKVLSPIRREQYGRQSSHEDKSPSPTKGHSPLSGVSSGFSSSRSSQDTFHLEQLSPVQQQLSEINHRYSLLGVKINDRQFEIDSVYEEVKKHFENLKTLSLFLDKVQKQLPKDIIPNTKEEADKFNKQIKHTLEEMYEKQSLLDSTKSQVKELIRRKTGSIGVDRLNTELEDVISHWKSLSDYLKNRIKFIEDMKEFHDTHDSLSAWLTAKDRMLTVLGPISSDSRMVQSQVQQVQVLREEFRSQQPQLQHLIEVGDSVLAYLDLRSPDGQKINSKLAVIQQRWTHLLSKLEERADSLGAAADTSREFDAQLTRLRDALQAISDNLDDLALDQDAEEQLRRVENLERQLEGQRPLLVDLEAAGAHLCDVLGDPASRADIQAKLAQVGRQFNALQKKLDHKKAELEGSLRDGRQFESSCAQTVGWLSDEISALSERLLVSADRRILDQQLATHEPIYRNVLSREHEVIMLLNKGHDIVSKNNKTDFRNLQKDLDKIQQQWDKLKKEAFERQTRLQTCKEHCRKYYQGLESFLPWLRQAEDTLNLLKPTSFQRKQIEKQLKELQIFRNEVWKKSGEYENTRSLGDTFLSACDIDKDIVKNELRDLKERWDKLNNDLIQRTQALEDQSRKLLDLNENLRDFQHGLERCEDKLASHDALGGAAKDPKLLDRVKSLRDETTKLERPLQVVRQQVTDLVNEAAEIGIDAHNVQEEVDGLGDRLTELQAKLDDRCLELQSAATAVSQFNNQVKILFQDLSSLEADLDDLQPPGRDIKIVKIQLDDVANLIKRISKTNDDVEKAIQAGEHLVDSGFAPDTAQTRQQVEGLRKQLGKLDDRARNREQELHTVLQKLENLYMSYANILDGIRKAIELLRKMKPVGSELENIRAQQQDFKKFRNSSVEPLNKSVEDCNRFGQGLIQSAAPNVSTSVLESDLEKMNVQWNNLKEKINDRERRLDVALLQSGKFQEALDGLAKWLTDTEELVANQKSPSADYKVVKAQLQEQKFLKKMLLDRQNSMSSLFSMGNEIAIEADPAERKVIEKQLKSLMGRFDALTEGAQQRTLDLEQAMKVAKEFQDKLIPLQEWLGKSERKIKEMEIIPTDEEKIQQRIREHDALHKDILTKKPDFRELTDIASNLMSLVGDDEASTLADKLQEVTDRYGHLVETSENIGQLLTASRQGLRHLVLTYQDLASWMDSMERRLGRYKVLAVHKDKLLEQMDDLTALTEELAGRQQDVDGTVDAGVELMRHISSDEALQLKDKLDSLQRRYNDLTVRGAELLKHAHDILPLVQQFHNNHNRLVEWMQGAELILQSAEPKESDIARLEYDLQETRPVLEQINVLGPQLCQASPGEGASTIEGLVTRDNRRFDAIAEQIQRRAERIHLGKQRALEVTSDIDELLEWFREVEGQLRDSEKPSAEPDLIRIQLKEHKALNDDISSQKGRVRDVLSTAKKVLRDSHPSEDTTIIREKMEDLRETMDTVSALSSDRLGILEQALPLAEHFYDTHNVLINWLTDMENQVLMLSMPALRPDLIAQQQDRNEMFIQSINEHKPLLDKLNKTGEALIRLCNDDDGVKVQEILTNDNDRYAALKMELRERQQALEQALQESSQFSDKLEGMLRALSNTADQVNNQEPISAHPPKIRDQIDDNDGLIGDLDKRKAAYAAVQRAADDVINKASNRSDPAIKDIRRKLDKLKSLWDEVQKATGTRGQSLENALDAAQKFWKELHAIMTTLKDLEDSLSTQEPAAVEPKAIQEQQVALQEIRQEIDQTKPEVDQVRSSGQKLMKLCGEPDKPEVKKHIEDLDNAWDNITTLYAKREENLIDAMEKAMEFHETLQNLVEFLDKAERKFSKLGPLGADIDAVKKQIGQLKEFKAEVDPHMVKVEALNRSLIRQAQELTERTSADQAAAIKEPLTLVNKRWDTLLRGIVDRQRQLENALLRLGQFQHALNELFIWIKKTDSTLDELKPVAGDPQILEIELAKLKVLVNDIQAHQSSIDTLNDAGRQIIESGEDEASVSQEKLNELNTQWRALMRKAADRQRELEDALNEAQRFNADIQDLLAWLGDADTIITSSKPVGGLPETASEQLERFMEIYNEIEDNRPKVETVLAQGQEYVKKSSNAASNLQHNLRTLKQRWDSVTARANDKKIKLEIALKEATEFHDALQNFVDWLTNAEKTLSNLKPVSRVLQTIQSQIEEHKVFQKDVSTHREIMLQLDKKGTHLKYFSQKQDVILIKNLLISVQHRWERVASKSAERTRALDLGYKEAKEFHDSWKGLMTWLEDTGEALDQILKEGVSNDPEQIKHRLARHQELQRALSGKQSSYDNILKAGKILKDKAPKTDEATIKQMLSELSNKWTSVCNKSIERQRKLEEALLYSGQFKDAIAALLDWLVKVERELSKDVPVHGDLDTVNHLVDLHRQFEKELERRNEQMESVMKTGQELQRKANKADATQLRSELVELNEHWDNVTKLTHLKSGRLREAVREAELLQRSVNMLLDWLSDAEMKLRFVGNTPEDEATAYEQLKTLDTFRAALAEKEVEKDKTLELAQSVLAKAHPDSINVIKNWIKVIQSRWEEVSQWALQRHQKLTSHMQSLKDLDDCLEELIKWLLGLENTLIALKREELPMDIPTTEQLIQDHKELMENTQRRQGEVDKICKAKQVKPVQGFKDTKKFAKGKGALRGSQHDIYESSTDLYGRKQSRSSPGREGTPEPYLPHIGPRFPPAGSEPEFRSPRVKFLYDKWRHVWMLSWERQRELYDHLAYLKEKKKADNFSWDDWRKRFLKFMNYKKSRLTDLFRKMDKDNNELIPREDFIEGIIKTRFDTSKLEMQQVADMFDLDNRGLIDWKKFIAALRPDWEDKIPNDSQKIHDEVKRLVMLCTCRQKFRVFQVGEGKYRFGESQKLRLVRILRSTVMVRVGGGWVALDEFLVKNDPCRAHEHMAELMPIFEQLRAKGEIGNAYPLHVGSTAGPTLHWSQANLNTFQWVRERSVRSTPMGTLPRTGKSSFSAGTPDSLSDNESAALRTPRRPSYRSTLTPGGSRTNSRPTSRTGSRPSSKPPSRHGSNLSLDSTDDATPSRIPRRTPMSGRIETISSSRKGVNGSTSGSRTPSGLVSPASPVGKSSGIPRAASIPTLSSVPNSSLRSVSKKQVTIGTAPTLRTAARTRTPSGSNTPVSPEATTAVSQLLRKPSGASDIRKKSTTTSREPFRL